MLGLFVGAWLVLTIAALYTVSDPEPSLAPSTETELKDVLHVHAD